MATLAGDWAGDLATLRQLVDDFVNAPTDRSWSDHLNFGRLSRREQSPSPSVIVATRRTAHAVSSMQVTTAGTIWRQI
jgi:hypothetical protein